MVNRDLEPNNWQTNSEYAQNFSIGDTIEVYAAGDIFNRIMRVTNVYDKHLGCLDIKGNRHLMHKEYCHVLNNKSLENKFNELLKNAQRMK